MNRFLLVLAIGGATLAGTPRNASAGGREGTEIHVGYGRGGWYGSVSVREDRDRHDRDRCDRDGCDRCDRDRRDRRGCGSDGCDRDRCDHDGWQRSRRGDDCGSDRGRRGRGDASWHRGSCDHRGAVDLTREIWVPASWRMVEARRSCGARYERIRVPAHWETVVTGHRCGSCGSSW